MATEYVDIPPGQGQYKDPVPTALDLPSVGNLQGDIRVTLDTGQIYQWLGNVWVLEPPPGMFTGTVTIVYGANTLVVNADGSLNSRSRMYDAAGNGLTSQVSGAQRALDVGIDVGGVQVDPRQIRPLVPTDVVTVDQGTSPWVVSGTFTLPANAATASNQTDGSQKTQIVDNAGNVAGPVVSYGSLNFFPVYNIANGIEGNPASGGVITAAGKDTFGNLQALSVDTSGQLNINNILGTISLPTGAATAANQTTANASLASINGKIPSGLTVTSTRLLVDGSGVTQPVSVASLPLPTGAATSANQVTQITSLQLLDDVPAAFNAAFSKGNPIMGQLDDTSTVVATEDNVAPARITAQRALHVNLRNNAGTEIATSANPLRTDPTGTTTQPVSAASLPLPTGAATEATLALLTQAQGSTTSGQSGPLVQGAVTTAQPSYTNGTTRPLSLTTTGLLRVNGADVIQPVSGTVNAIPTSSGVATYSAVTNDLATALLATDIFTITGSATKTVKVTLIRVTAVRTTSTTTDITLVKRSTANTGGTSTAETMVPHDSNNAAATAVVRSYTANPTTGALVGSVREEKMFINVAATGTSDRITWEFGIRPSQPIVLRGTSQVLAINLSGVTITGPNFDIYVEWTEE